VSSTYQPSQTAATAVPRLYRGSSTTHPVQRTARLNPVTTRCGAHRDGVSRRPPPPNTAAPPRPECTSFQQHATSHHLLVRDAPREAKSTSGPQWTDALPSINMQAFSVVVARQYVLVVGRKIPGVLPAWTPPRREATPSRGEGQQGPTVLPPACCQHPFIAPPTSAPHARGSPLPSGRRISVTRWQQCVDDPRRRAVHTGGAREVLHTSANTRGTRTFHSNYPLRLQASWPRTVVRSAR